MTSVNTLLPGHSLRGFLSHQGTKTTWAMAFPRINCRTTTATVLTAAATVTLCFVCVCASFCPISCHKSIGGRSSSGTSSRQRSSGLSRRVAAANRRSERSARRAGPREARIQHVVDLARQSRAMVFAWWNPCIIRPCCAADGGARGAGQEEQVQERVAL